PRVFGRFFGADGDAGGDGGLEGPGSADMRPRPMCAETTPLTDHPYIRAVSHYAVQLGGKAVLVGGAVRDWRLTGALPHDLDFLVLDTDAGALAKAIADGMPGGRLVPLDPQWGIHRVVFPEELCPADDQPWTVDLAQALGNDLDR